MWPTQLASLRWLYVNYSFLPWLHVTLLHCYTIGALICDVTRDIDQTCELSNVHNIANWNPPKRRSSSYLSKFGRLWSRLLLTQISADTDHWEQWTAHKLVACDRLSCWFLLRWSSSFMYVSYSFLCIGRLITSRMTTIYGEQTQFVIDSYVQSTHKHLGLFLWPLTANGTSHLKMM